MNEFIGVIKPFASSRIPRGWLPCSGQLLEISDYEVLFYLLGTQFGGDGISTFALPNLSGRVAVGAGKGAGLSHTFLGEIGGSENVSLNSSQMPSHSHTMSVNPGKGTDNNPTGKTLAVPAGAFVTDLKIYDAVQNASTQLNPRSIGLTGGSQAHTNMQPSLGLNYIICVDGIYPSPD